MKDIYEQKAIKYKYKYLKLKKTQYIGEGGTLQAQEEALVTELTNLSPEEALVTELTNSSPEEAKNILANITNLDSIVKILSFIRDIPNNNNKYILILIYLIMERRIELEVHQEQKQKLETHVKKLVNIQVILTIKSASASTLLARTHANAHTQSLLEAAQAKLRLAYYQVEKVKEAQDSAKQVLEALKAGKLPNENISIKQRRIEETVKKVEEELNLADFILKQGTEIVEEIEQEREAQISKSEIRLSLARNKSQRMPEGRLKNRS
jgi:hypothetical protein